MSFSEKVPLAQNKEEREMRTVKLVGLLAIAAMLVATAVRAGTLPPGNRNPSYLSGTFGFRFSGGEPGTDRVSGVGTITFDGRGNVVGGIFHCDINGAQYNPPIEGGRYSINIDGSGYATIDTGASLCSHAEGVDLYLNIVNGGATVLFATDGSDNFYNTGFFSPFDGEMHPL